MLMEYRQGSTINRVALLGSNADAAWEAARAGEADALISSKTASSGAGVAAAKKAAYEAALAQGKSDEEARAIAKKMGTDAANVAADDLMKYRSQLLLQTEEMRAMRADDVMTPASSSRTLLYALLAVAGVYLATKG